MADEVPAWAAWFSETASRSQEPGTPVVMLQGRAPIDVLTELLPDGDLSGRMAAITGKRAGAGLVADLSARVHGLRLADDVLAGGDLIVPAFRELDSAVSIYQNSTHSEEVGRGMLTAIGEFAQIAGWVASDAGLHDRAADTYRLGISAAREAGDGTLESNLLGSLAYQEANVGDSQRAVGLARAALEAAGPDAPPRARALAWDRIAWAYTRADDAQSTMEALGEAGTALAGPGDADGPAYLYWVGASELQVMEARAYTELRRPLRAVPLLIDVLGPYDATHTRELALYLSWLAVALADAREPEEAAATAARMLELSADLASDRTAQRARVVLASLESYRDVPQVRDLLVQYAGDLG
ncbi:transcriptional regulator [Sphaerisporangium corydalis]|uniref:Transcriptional regulator n=1 Tax=Sphaerisporangium corydalis TaxID=1441875 RepID=A0ABV9E5X1_9ACTN|nr:transcriptional regulator [Sphaerisporangium corydalis]